MDKLKINVDKLLADINLIVCSPLAQGVYFRLMLVFHKSDEYGCVSICGVQDEEESLSPSRLKKLSAMCGMEVVDVHNGVYELLENNVLRCEYRDSGAFLFDPMMVSARRVSQIRSEIGKKGGGNPSIKPTPKAIELTMVPEPESKEGHNPKPRPSPQKSTYTDADFLKDLIGLGADEELARLWIMVRKKRKQFNSPVVIKKIPKTLVEINMGINEALEFLVHKSWGGMEVRYFKNQDGPYAPRLPDRKKNEQTKLDLTTYSQASNL